MKRRTWAVALMALALVLVACSSNEKGPLSSGSNSPTPSSSLPGGSATPGGGTTRTPGTGTPTGRGSTSSPTSTPTFGPSSAKLDKSCVRRGVSSDRQGITIKTDPGGPASYYTVYSDGSSIQDRPGLYQSGGQNGGFADPSGRYRDTWVVPLGAPTGKATVRVVVAGRNKPIDLTFRVASQTGSCS